MEVPRHWRLKKIRYGLGLEATLGQYSGLPIAVTGAPRPMLEHFGLTPEQVMANQAIEARAKQDALVIPVLIAITESVS